MIFSDGAMIMKLMKKLFHSNLDLFLPLVALLIGVLIMVFSTPIAVQAILPVPMPQSFAGEYSYDQENWYPLESAEKLSALDGDLYLRGHFEQNIYEESRLYYYSDHIGCEMSINGEPYWQDIVLEIEQYDIDLQPSMCMRGWQFLHFPTGLSADAQVEIHLKNPHAFGNKNAYKEFLSTLYCTINNPEFLEKYIDGFTWYDSVTGIIFVIAGILLLGAALVSALSKVPLGSAITQNGLLSCCVGIYILLDTLSVTFWSEKNIVNSYGWQISMMYSVYLLGIMAKNTLQGANRKKIAVYVVALSAAANMVMILLSFAGATLIYDTLRWWVILQWICCPVLGFCCAAELFSAKKEDRVMLVLFLLLFVSILLDTLGILGSLYSRGTITKLVIVVFFLYVFFRALRNVFSNYKAFTWSKKLEKELEESRIAIMLSQIQPHFIFNVLGTLRGLCRENPEQAWYGLGDFAAYLRGNMNALTNEKSIPFEAELRHVETYLRLEKMRLGEKLSIVYNIQEKDFMIPPLTLQPLVENAVKHGIFYKADGGTIIIHSRLENGSVVISVEDDGVGFESSRYEPEFDQREHVGLTNVRNRVEKMLGGSLMIESIQSGGTMVTLEFPVKDHMAEGV